jgi:predicted metalloenzyme YecM
VELLEQHGFLELVWHAKVKHHRLGLWPLLQAGHRVPSRTIYILEGAEPVIIAGGTLNYVSSVLPDASTLPHDGFEHLEVFDLALFLLDEVVITEVDEL